MPNRKRTHEESRKVLCLLCVRKGKDHRLINNNIRRLIENHCIDGLMIDDPRLPASICLTCRNILMQYDKGIFTKSIDVYDHSKFAAVKPYLTRSKNDNPCDCLLCDIARENINKASAQTELQSEKASQNKATVMKICSNCLSHLSRGKIHECNRVNAVSNVRSILPDNVIEKVASSIIKQKAKISDDVKLATTTGKPIRLELNQSSPSKSKKVITANEVSHLQTDLNLSTRQTHILCKNVRSFMKSRTVIESNLKENLHSIAHSLDAFFDVSEEEYIFTQKNVITNRVNRFTVRCNDVNELKQHVLQERGLSENDAKVKIGLDGGGGFFKVCMTIFSDVEEPSRGCKERKSFEENPSKEFLYSGVKKILLMSITPMIEENYVNLKKIWINLGLNRFQGQFTIASDLKLINMLLGLMSHSCSHPCCYCTAKNTSLLEEGNQRTLQSVLDSFFGYMSSGRKINEAKQYGNVIHPPILTHPNKDTPILELIPPPELHLFIGVVNTIYKAMISVWPEGSKWLDLCYCHREGMHSGTFTGNTCKNLLNKVDILASICPVNIMPFVAAYRAFKKVVTSCFGYYLESTYKEDMEMFKLKYIELPGASVTPKLHIIFCHVPKFCEISQSGLGRWSEQTSESIHHDFNETWKRFKVNSLNNPEYGNRLLQAVRCYNGQHV